MKHFGDEAWLDFARNVLPAEDAICMQRHLDSGCQRCADLAALWQTVSEIARRGSDDAPAESAVIAVKSAFTANQRQTKSVFDSFVGKLVFDSFAGAPVVAGIRAISSTARHLLYEAGQWTIDVRVENERGGSVTIAGQVLEAAAVGSDEARAEVSLMHTGRVISRSSTNEFGEFQFECDGGAGLQLTLEIDGQVVSVSLPE